MSSVPKKTTRTASQKWFCDGSQGFVGLSLVSSVGEGIRQAVLFTKLSLEFVFSAWRGESHEGL